MERWCVCVCVWRERCGVQVDVHGKHGQKFREYVLCTCSLCGCKGKVRTGGGRGRGAEGGVGVAVDCVCCAL